ncbi:MAG TPA: lysophospholipase [Spirochaetota bacterium]|nr:lysophospholipase [Spirochaetota bacterium]
MKGYKHGTGTFIGKGGVEIYFREWMSERPKGIVVLAHGLGEHSGRYANLIDRMQGSGVSFYALDHRGHGRSGGKRGHIASFMDYIQDLNVFMTQIKDEYGSLPVVLLGHSLGGVIAMKYALTYPAGPKALVLSSAGLVLAVKVPKWKKKMGLFFSRHIPALSMRNELDANDLSHDRQTVDDYVKDPLVHDQVTARWYTEFIAAGEECLRRASELRMPLLVIHGKADKMVDYRGSERVYASVSTPARDKALFVFSGLYHETMNETPPERTKVLDVLAGWITMRLGAKSAGAKKTAKTTKAVKKRKTAKKSVLKKAKKSLAKKTNKPAGRPAKKKAPTRKAAAIKMKSAKKR